jgi:hypothetical protein
MKKPPEVISDLDWDFDTVPDNEWVAQRMSRGKPRLPWKRGPVAWEIAQRADSILETLKASRRGFYSLRRTAKLLGISTQPVRDWIRLGYLKREGPRGQIAKGGLDRFLGDLEKRAEPFDPRNYLERIPRTYPFKKLGRVRFEWPKGRDALKPSELATLAGCHPSLVIKAIRCRKLRGRRRSPCRFEISKAAWHNAWF